MIHWSPSEAAGVHEFLSTQLGVKWLGYLFDQRPRLEPKDLKTTESAALAGAYAGGYEHVFSVIALSRTVLPAESVSAKPIDMTKD